MKIYKKIVLDLNGQVIEEDSYEYEGPIAQCGGGGGAGKIEYPAGMESAYLDLINDETAITLLSTNSITHQINTISPSSIYATAVAYDPDADIAEMVSKATELGAAATLLSTGTGLDTLVSNVLSDAKITADSAAFGASLDAQIATSVVPRFEAGMRDINAVMSSAFVIGRALIEDGRDREVAKYETGLRVQAFGELSLRLIELKIQALQAASNAYDSTYKGKIVAKKEELESNLEYDYKDLTWVLELGQYYTSALGSLAGAPAGPGGGKPNKAASAISGTMMGAGVGAMIGSSALTGVTMGGMSGGPLGAVIGGVMGLGMGLAQAFS